MTNSSLSITETVGHTASSILPPAIPTDLDGLSGLSEHQSESEPELDEEETPSIHSRISSFQNIASKVSVQIVQSS